MIEKASQEAVKAWLEGLPDSRSPEAEMLLRKLNRQRLIIEDLGSPAMEMVFDHLIVMTKHYAEMVLEPTKEQMHQTLKCPECKKGQISVNHAFYHGYKSVLKAVSKLVADYKADNERIAKGELRR